MYTNILTYNENHCSRDYEEENINHPVIGEISERNLQRLKECLKDDDYRCLRAIQRF